MTGSRKDGLIQVVIFSPPKGSNWVDLWLEQLLMVGRWHAGWVGGAELGNGNKTQYLIWAPTSQQASISHLSAVFSYTLRAGMKQRMRWTCKDMQSEKRSKLRIHDLNQDQNIWQSFWFLDEPHTEGFWNVAECSYFCSFCTLLANMARHFWIPVCWCFLGIWYFGLRGWWRGFGRALASHLENPLSCHLILQLLSVGWVLDGELPRLGSRRRRRREREGGEDGEEPLGKTTQLRWRLQAGIE